MTPKFKALTPAGEWVEGWFDHSVKNNPMIVVISENYKGYNIKAVLPETVCMATGRPDSTGKMMYNGDEITFSDTEITPMQTGTEYDPVLSRGYIYWDSDECKFYVTNILSAQISEVWESATLTGKNIHDKTSAE